MKIETKKNLFFEGFTGKTEFQSEVVRIILSDDKFLVFYIGAVDGLTSLNKYDIFGRYKNGERVKIKDVSDKFNALLTLFNDPKWCIIMWKKVKCKYIERKPKLKKDGTPRVPHTWSKKKKIKE